MNLFLTANGRPLGIPYFRDEPGAHSYIDVKADRGAIDRIPEIQDHPDFKALVLDFNSPDSPFRTLGCDQGGIQESADSARIGSYISIALGHWPDNKDVYAYYRIFHEFAIFARKNTNFANNEDVRITFDLIHFEHRAIDLQGWAVDIWIQCLGDSLDVARERWSTCIKLLHDYLIHVKGICVREAPLIIDRSQLEP